MEWENLKSGPNPAIVRFSAKLAAVLVAIWIGSSLFFASNGEGIPFQRFGAFGVGALLMYYVFIRFTWRRRSESISALEYAGFAALLAAKSEHENIERSKKKMLEVAALKSKFVKEEATSVVIEASLFLSATLQWGFGDLFVNFIHCGGVKC